MRKGINNIMWVLVTILLGIMLFFMAEPIADMISSAISTVSGCTNLDNVIGDATGVETC